MRRGKNKISFFKAGDGIRDVAVTGVQTCALPICGIFRVFWSANPLNQNFRRRHAHFAKRLPDGCEPGILVSRALNVVKSNDRDVLWNSPSSFAQSADGAQRGNIVECEKRGEGRSSAQ